MALTLGVLGTDHPHGPGHMKSFAQSRSIGRVLVWGTDPARVAEVCAQTAGAEAAASREQVLDPEVVDAVAVMLPTVEAGPATLEAVERGLYVYGDKPGALTAAEMAQIAEAGERTGADFCPCYPWRVEPMTRDVRRLIAEGYLGDVWSFQATWLTSQVALRGADQWLFRQAEAGAGILVWLACHWIDLLAHLLGPATELTAMVGKLCDEAIDVEDVGAVVLRQPAGGIGVVRAGYVHRPFLGYEEQDMHLSFEGSLGSIYWPLYERRGFRLRSGHPELRGASRRWMNMEYDGDPRELYASDFLEGFMKAVQTRTAPPATARDALYVLRVLEAAYRSSREGTAVGLG